MKYTEYACYNEPNSEQLRKNVFEALKYNINGISIPIYFLGNISSLIPEGITLGCPVDWPCGNNATTIRNHAAIYAINHGANALDLVSSGYMFINDHSEYVEDIKSHIKICKDRGVTLRVMLEYRRHFPAQTLDMALALSELGVDYIFPSTGDKLDDFSDNLIVSHRISTMYTTPAIFNGNIFTQKQYKILCESRVHGVRFNNLGALIRLLGV